MPVCPPISHNPSPHTTSPSATISDIPNTGNPLIIEVEMEVNYVIYDITEKIPDVSEVYISLVVTVPVHVPNTLPPTLSPKFSVK